METTIVELRYGDRTSANHLEAGLLCELLRGGAATQLRLAAKKIECGESGNFHVGLAEEGQRLADWLAWLISHEQD